MKYKILVLMLFLSSFVYAANLNLTLDENTLGTQNPISGYLKLNINDIPSVGELVFDIGGSEKKFNLTEVCSLTKSSCSLSSEQYEILQPEIQDPTITFSDANTNSDYAISLYLSQQSYLDISDASLSISGESYENVYPSKVKLDIGSDGFDWNYIGDYVKENNQIVTHLIPTDYLYNKIPDPNLKGVLYGSGRFELCEKVKIPLTKRVVIKTFVQVNLKNDVDFPGVGYLSGRIRDQNGEVLINDLGLKANCSMQEPPLNADWVWRECAIDGITINEDKDYYICVYSNPDVENPPLTDVAYYNVALEKSSPINSGYDCSRALSCSNQCCYSDGFDYFIEGYWSENNLNFDVKKSIDKEKILLPSIRSNILSGQCKYVSTYNSDNYCLIPLIVSSNSKGKIKFSDLLISYNYPIQGTSFAKVNFIPKKINYINNMTLDLSKLDLVAPASTGDYDLNVELKYGGKVYDSISEGIEVLDSPKIAFTIPKYSYVGGSINLSANISGGESPYSYNWDFGDGEFSTDENPSHSYTIEGSYNVTLEVTDSNDILSVYSQEIEIINLEEILEPLLNDTYDIVTDTLSKFSTATGDIKEVVDILGINEKLNTAKTNISSFMLSYKSAMNDPYNKNQKLSVIYNSLNTLKDDIPYEFQVNSLNYNPKVFEDGSYKNYNSDLQNYFNVVSKIYLINAKYISNREETISLIKKDISLTGSVEQGYIYEYIPKEVSSTISKEDILVDGFDILEEDPLISFQVSGSKDIIYKLPNADVDSLTKIKTYLVVEGYTPGFENEPECGDGICSPLEEGYCDKDCKRNIPWLFFTFLFLILVGGIYYINFYKGKWNFQELVKFIKAKLKKKKLFNADKDRISLENYIKRNLRLGFKESQLRIILSKKKWRKDQLDFIFNKLKKEKFK